MTRPFGWTLVVALAASLSLAACGGQNYEKADSKSGGAEHPAAQPASQDDQKAHDGMQATEKAGEAKEGELLAANCTCSTDKAGCKCGHCVGAVDVCHCRH